jgi:murein DD-endopeptidase MepM/ murein hydrolase activator NlpD
MGRGLIVFALLVTGGLTLLLGRPASSQRHIAELATIIVSANEADAMVRVDTLRRGEVLAQVLGRLMMNGNEIAELVAEFRHYANPRSLRAGVTVQVERTAWDSLVAVSIQSDPDHVVRLTREGTIWSGQETEIQIRVDTLLLAGSISSSLYNSVMDFPDRSLGQAERIERVMWGIYRPFQWSIDFGIDLRQGDTYRAVYERHSRPDGSVKNARVLAAEFTNRGRTYTAFWLGSRREYFDEDGESMKMVFLKAPVDFRRISSRFSRNRYHPKLGVNRPHLGTDYAANTGTRVYSTADGTITRAGWWGGYGRVIEVRHVNGYRSRYAHLSFIAKGIKPGVRVRQGQLIGHVGSSGLATGPHLHYELWHNSKAVDHRNINLPSGQPVGKDHVADFRRNRDELISLLSRANPFAAKRAD